MGSLCLMIIKVVIGTIKIQNLKLKTLLKLADTTSMIEFENIRKEKNTFSDTKLINQKRSNMEKRLN